MRFASCLLMLGLSLLGEAAHASEYRFDGSKYRFDAGACPFDRKAWFVPDRMRCGYLVVEERVGEVPFRLPLIRIERVNRSSTAAPVVFLNGGPGGPGISDVDEWLAHPLLLERDLILFDPRGSGRAEPAPCPELGAEILELFSRDLDSTAVLRLRTQQVSRCFARIPVDRSFASRFSSRAIAKDVEAVRNLLGYERLSLYAVSYGTRAAMTYAAEHPGRVESMVLDSVVPLDRGYYEEIGASFQRALERLFADCEQSLPCGKRFPRLRQDYRELVTTLERRPLSIRIPRSRLHADGVLHLNAQDFVLLMHQLLYGAEFIPTVPLLIDELKRGNGAPLALTFDIAVGMRVRMLNFATYYLVLGNEELSRSAPTSAAPSSSGFNPDFFEQDIALLRSLGGVFAPTPEFAPTPQSPALAAPVPTLVLAGRYDPITRPEYGRAAAAALAGARYVEFAGVGHAPSFSNACARNTVVGFLQRAAAGPPSACAQEHGARPFVTDLLRSSGLFGLAESVFYSESLAPLVWPLVPAAMYVAALIWLVGSVLLGKARVRAGRQAKGFGFGRRRAILVFSGLFFGIALWISIPMLVMHAVSVAPGMLLYGLPSSAVYAVGLAAILLAVTAWMLVEGATAWWKGRWNPAGRLYFTNLTLANAALLAFLSYHGLL